MKEIIFINVFVEKPSPYKNKIGLKIGAYNDYDLVTADNEIQQALNGWGREEDIADLSNWDN